MTTLVDAQKAAEHYGYRWKIECLFKHLKPNGFHLEDLNLKDRGKNLLMFAVAATAYTLTIRRRVETSKKHRHQNLRRRR